MRKNLWKGMVALAVLIACFLCGTAFAAPENAKSLEPKLALMKENNLAGTAAWTLGQETQDIWELILQYTN